MPIISHMLSGKIPVGRPDILTSTNPAPTGFSSLWGAVLDAFVPFGYEDHDGFHYGCPVPLPSALVGE